MSGFLQKFLRNRIIVFSKYTSRRLIFQTRQMSCSCTVEKKCIVLQVNPQVQRSKLLQPFAGCTRPTSLAVFHRSYSSSNEPNKKVNSEVQQDNEDDDMKKLGLFQRFKKMYRDYWYVLIPVHLATSAVWVGIFYYLATSGVDVVAMLEKLGAGESILGFVRNSNTGYFAITYALYKIATPARYTVTLGGTTLSINYLKRWGYIKPMPTKTQLKEMFEERRDNFKDNLREKKESFFKSRHKD